ncbi:MAG: aspartate aminotransferase family protein [Acidimicrobiia bacterium]|nr:MAG: aspartate aminotransferase family protein [Acidimicrobiia bacterium]
MAKPTFLHPFAPPARDASDYVSIVGGRGAEVVDSYGNVYIDAMASLWYANAGYGQAAIADAISNQAHQLAAFHAFTSWTNEPADALADRISALCPHDHARVFFCSSGSEAVESAMKIARAGQAQAGHSERTVIISRERAYHGVGYGGTSISGLPPNRATFGPFVGDIVNVDADDLGKMEAVMEEYRGEIAAVITEPVQGAGGVWPPPDGYLDGLRQLCDQHGAYLIFDEVITGFGRLGTWFASQRFGVTPDLTTFAKAVTSGYQPLGGVIVGDAVTDTLESDSEYILRHGFTYSGHPTACAAGLANIDLLEREGLLSRVAAIERILGEGLGAFVNAGLVSDARGIGGMWAISMTPECNEADVAARMLEAGVIVRPLPQTITFCPPLVISDEQLEQVVSVAREALG